MNKRQRGLFIVWLLQLWHGNGTTWQRYDSCSRMPSGL